MSADIGTTDRVLRLVGGATLIVLALTGTVGSWGWIGVVPLATALLRWCP